VLNVLRFAALSKNGEAETLAALDLSLVHGLNEKEVQSAIEELNRSTASIEKQTESLKLQQNAMKSLVKSENRVYQSRSHMEKGQVRKWEVEKGHICAAV
jgi:hypothetical protein